MILNKCEPVVIRVLLHVDEPFKDEANLLTLNATINFALSTNRLDGPLYLL